MADHTITIQSEGLGSPIRGSNEPSTFSESSKLLAEEIRNLLKEMQKSNPNATYRDAQRQFHQGLNSTAAARNAGRPDVWAGQTGRGPTAGYALQPVEGGGGRGEPFYGEPSKNPWEILDRWRNGANDPNRPMGISEEEAHILDKKRDSSQGHFGRGDVSDDGFYSDWRSAKHKIKNPDQYQRNEDISSDEHDDREAAMEAVNVQDDQSQGGGGGGGDGGGGLSTFEQGVADASGGAAEAAAGTAQAIATMGATGWDKIGSGAAKVGMGSLKAVGGLAGSGLNAATHLGTGGAEAAVTAIGSSNVQEQADAVGGALQSVSGAAAELTSVIPGLGGVMEGLDGVVGGVINTFKGFMAAMDNASEEVMGFNPDILMERIGTEIEVLHKQIQRAQIVGDELADWEEQRGDFVSVMEDIKTILIKILGPLVTQILKMVTELLERFLENIPHLLNALASGVEALATIAAGIPGIGATVSGALTNIALGIQGMAQDAADALALLRGPATPADLAFGNWLMGGTVDAMQVPGVNHPRIPFGLNP